MRPVSYPHRWAILLRRRAQARGNTADSPGEGRDAASDLEHEQALGGERGGISTQFQSCRVARENFGEASESLSEPLFLVGRGVGLRPLDDGSSSGKPCLRLPRI